jgi:hypothetical protein
MSPASESAPPTHCTFPDPFSIVTGEPMFERMTPKSEVDDVLVTSLKVSRRRKRFVTPSGRDMSSLLDTENFLVGKKHSYYGKAVRRLLPFRAVDAYVYTSDVLGSQGLSLLSKGVNYGTCHSSSSPALPLVNEPPVIIITASHSDSLRLQSVSYPEPRGLEGKCLCSRITVIVILFIPQT